MQHHSILHSRTQHYVYARALQVHVSRRRLGACTQRGSRGFHAAPVVTATSASTSASTDTQDTDMPQDTSLQKESSGGFTPGSWNLGIAHSAASRADQRSYVDRLFAVYGTLMAAASRGDVPALEALMDTTYTPAPDESTAKIRDAQVRAAAISAATLGRGKALQLLLDKGADLGFDSSNNSSGRSSSEGGSISLANECQVSAGRPICDRSSGGDSVDNSSGHLVETKMAIEAASMGHDEVLDVLLSGCGVSIEARDANRPGNRTALMEAAANGHVQCVARCVQAGADLDAATHDTQRCTAAMLAAVNGHTGCLNVLRGAGADMEVQRGGDGKTAMALHREKVAEDMARFSSRALKHVS